MAAKPKNMPVLDFSRVPRRRFMKQFSRLTNRVTKLHLEIEDRHDRLAAQETEAESAPPSRDDQRQVQQQIVAMLDELDAIAEEQERLMRQIVASVPAEWMHEAAPDGMSLDDPEFFDWLADGRFQQLINIVQSDSKNWPAPTS